jgi:pyrroloquinoline-quinone synthase
MSEFFAALDARIARYDLLQHPFYQAWSKGELTRDELREYASEYWHHVSAFPTYLSALHTRLEDAPLRRTVLENLADEEGLPAGRAHSDLWMDFATGMGADSTAVRGRVLQPETTALLEHFRTAMQAAPAPALAAGYFTLHQTADVYHAQVWRDAIEVELTAHPEHAETALDTAEATAAALWETLSGIERERQRARVIAA